MRHAILIAATCLLVGGCASDETATSELTTTGDYVPLGSNIYRFYIDSSCRIENEQDVEFNNNHEIVVYPGDQAIFVNERDTDITLSFGSDVVFGVSTLDLPGRKRKALSIGETVTKGDACTIKIQSGCTSTTGGGSGDPKVIVGDWP